MREAVAAVGRRRAAAGASVSLRVGLGLHLNHPADAGAERGGKKRVAMKQGRVLFWPGHFGQ